MTARVVDRLSAVWAKDPCVCGHTRAGHVLLPRQPWPATGRRYGRCTDCSCPQLDLDVAQMEADAAAVRAQRLAAFRADPKLNRR